MTDHNGVKIPTWLWSGVVVVVLVGTLAAAGGWLFSSASANREKNGVQDTRLATIDANYANLILHLNRIEAKIDKQMEARP